MRFDLLVSGPEEMSRDELVVVVHRQAGQITSQAQRITVQDQQIAAQAGQLAALMETNEELAAKVARLEHLLSRNSGNSGSPPSKDDDLGRTPPVEKTKRRDGAKRSRGKQTGAPGSHLPWSDTPDERRDLFPQGSCGCGQDLGAALDLGIVDRYQQHEIPQVSVKITQFDSHEVACACGQVHTATRPDGARSGPVGYGPNLQAFAVYLLVVVRHEAPGHRAEVEGLRRWVVAAA